MERPVTLGIGGRSSNQLLVRAIPFYFKTVLIRKSVGATRVGGIFDFLKRELFVCPLYSATIGHRPLASPAAYCF